MDLISRDKAQEIIPKVVLGMSDFAECIRDSVDSVFDNCPSAFEGMTNGEVIKAIFPNANYESCTNFMHITSPNICGVTFFWDFWNAPYKAESEDKE